jgi:REP element-mobilizing transposase RayT
VVLRGNHRQSIFAQTSDWQRWEEILVNVLEKLEGRIHGYCWMTNHVHMLIQVGTVPLWRLVHRFASPYARYFQRKLSTTGHLFERRHRANLVDTDDYLLQLLYYIHMNPVTADLVPDPTQYRWSSYKAYLGLANTPWLITDFALSMFSDDLTKARRLFREFIPTAEATNEKSIVSGRPTDSPRPLNPPTARSGSKSPPGRVKPRLNLDTLIDQVAAKYGVTRQELQSNSKRRRATEARAEIARQAQDMEIATISDVARQFGRATATMSRSVATLREVLKKRSKDARSDKR